MKLAINKAAGIVDIIAAIVYLVAPFLIVGAALGETSGAIGEGSTSSSAIFVSIIALVGLILHIVALVKSRKAQISNVGNILGIVGHAIFLVFGILLSLPAMVLAILSAVFTLRQKSIATASNVSVENNSNNSLDS